MASIEGLPQGILTGALAARRICDTTVLMKRQTVIPRKKRGPAPTGKGEPIMVRVQPPLLEKIDAWSADQNDQPSRPEAIRRLTEQALKGKRKSRE
jgi:hypothetical protein